MCEDNDSWNESIPFPTIRLAPSFSGDTSPPELYNCETDSISVVTKNSIVLLSQCLDPTSKPSENPEQPCLRIQGSDVVFTTSEMKAFIAPTLPIPGATPVNNRTPPKCTQASPHTRRTVLKLLASVPLALLPLEVHAASMAELRVQKNVTAAKLSMKKAKSLYEELDATKTAALSDEDKDYIRRYSALWLENGRTALVDVSTQKAVKMGDMQKLSTLAAQLMGHMVELRAEIGVGKRDRVLEELDEYMETIEAFLQVPEVKKYVK